MHRFGLSVVFFGVLALSTVFTALFVLNVGMLPLAISVPLLLVNLITAFCYYAIPIYLEKTPDDGLLSIVKSDRFRYFIFWCGLHHIVHIPFMLAIAAFSAPQLVFATGFVLVLVDTIMAYHSVKTVFSLAH